MADPSAALATWKHGSNPCGAEPWQGVVCAGGWVVAVRLEGQSLQGKLTTGLVKVSNLQGLYLSNNQLTGELKQRLQCFPARTCFSNCVSG
jgi:hypothetical protein